MQHPAVRSGKVLLLDTTMRDGEQTNEVEYEIDALQVIGKKLDEIGVDITEVPFPASSEGCFQEAQTLCKSGLKAETLGLSRAVSSDIDKVVEAGADSALIFISLDPLSLEHKYKGKTLEYAIDRATKAIKYAKEKGLKVETVVETSSRVDVNVLRDFFSKAVDAGTDRVAMADTIGEMLPSEITEKVTKVKEVVGDTPIGVHCHNDLGMATANALTAYEAGAAEIHVTGIGLGERTGLCGIESIIAGLKKFYQVTKYDISKARELAGYLSETLDRPINPKAPVIGEQAIQHDNPIAYLHISDTPLITGPAENKAGRNVIITDSTAIDSIPTETITEKTLLNCQRVAREVDRVGVQYIDAGHPAGSENEKTRSQAICSAGLKAKTICTAKAMNDEVDVVLDVGASSVRFEIGSTLYSDEAGKTIDAIKYAKQQGLEVEVGVVFDSGVDTRKIQMFFKDAQEAGCDRMMINDKYGILRPTTTNEMVGKIKAVVDKPLLVKCNNAYDMGCANALTAYMAGAEGICTSTNGLGEGAGNPDLANILVGLRLKDNIEKYTLSGLYRLSQYVELVSHIPVPTKAPITGRDAFTHKAGVHTSAVTRLCQLYEVFEPELVGRTRVILQDELGGITSLEDRFRKMGMEVADAPDRLKLYMEKIKAGKVKLPPKTG